MRSAVSDRFLIPDVDADTDNTAPFPICSIELGYRPDLRFRPVGKLHVRVEEPC